MLATYSGRLALIRNDYVNVPNLASILNGTASLSFWIKTTQIGNDLVEQAPGISGVAQLAGTDDIFWGWLDATGHVGIATGNDSAAKSTTSINDGTWHHVALTRNFSSGAYTIYIDGVLDKSGMTGAGVIGTTFSSLGRIESTAGTPKYFTGELDEINIFTSVIDLTQVNALMNRSRTCPLMCFSDNFDRPSLGSDWSVSNNSGSFGDPRIVSGRLRLTDASNNVATSTTLLRLFPGANNKIIYDFDLYDYAGNGADGVAVPPRRPRFPCRCGCNSWLRGRPDRLLLPGRKWNPDSGDRQVRVNTGARISVPSDR